jgi:hypothetical protein
MASSDPSSISDAPPEVTIEPADNGFVVRHHQRSSKKDESGRTVRRVASSVDDALEHARTALGGSSKSSKKKTDHRDGQSGTADAGDGSTAPAAQSLRGPSRGRARRRHPRVGGRR